MKNFIKVLLIMAMFVPMIAHADLGAPMIREFEAEVIAETGLTVKDYNNKTVKFKKGDTVVVTGSGTSYQIVYKNNYYDLKSEDIVAIKPKTQSVNPNDKNIFKLDKTREFEVVVEKLDVYAGPASVYEKVGHISKGEQVTAFYAAKSESYSDYFYIQEDELKGWIYIGNGGENDHFNVREVNATTLKAIITKDITLNGTLIKANTVETIYYWANPWITTVPIIKVNNEMITLDDNDSYNLINEGKKPGTSFKERQFNILFKKDTKMYSTMKGSEVLETIPSGTKLSTVNLVYELMGASDTDTIDVLVFFNNKLGWVRVTTMTSEFLEEDELVAPYTDIEGDDDTEPTTEVEEEEKVKTVKIDKKQMAIIAVVVAVSVAVLAFSTIILLDKKNKKTTLDEINEELEKTQSIKVVKKDKKEDK